MPRKPKSKPDPGRVGVCSWSLGPCSARDLALKVRACGLSTIQLALDPLRRGEWSVEGTRSALNGIAIPSGMLSMCAEDYSSPASIRASGGVRPDRHWQANLRVASESASLAAQLGLQLVSLHAGFLPENPRDPERRKMVDRLRDLVDVFAERGVRVAFETGQERADTLLEVLEQLERPQVGVNFDPANMLLYDMGDPIEALRSLAPRIAQIHIKDARRPSVRGTWGEEVVAGTGEVDWKAFFDVLREHSLHCDLMIEREAGEDREVDIRRARALVEEFQGAGSGA